MKGKKLYEACELCAGTRKTEREISVHPSEGRGTLPIGSPCPCCKTGFCEIGMTDIQLERLIEERDALLSLVLEVHDFIPAQWGAGVQVLSKVRLIELKAKAADLVKDRRARYSSTRARLAVLAKAAANAEASPPAPKPSGD